MALQPQRHLFTLEEYEQMIDKGVFHAESRIELIRGEIIEMAPIGFDHGAGVAKVNRLFSRLVDDNVLVWVQSPIRVGRNSRPEPDLALLKWRDDYGDTKPPTAEDVILIVEVADTTLKFDRTIKAQLYAEAGIPEYWIVNLQKGVVEVFSNPAGGIYKQTQKANPGDTLPLPSTIGDSVQVSDILGK